MAKKPYSPTAAYSALAEVEAHLQQATNADDIRKLVVSHGPKVGYKAFCYMLGGKMSAAAMKPDEACEAAAQLEAEGQTDAARAIYQEITAVHKDHPQASQKLGELTS